MPVTVTCACGKRVGVADALIGKTIRCPKCGEKVLVAAPAAPAGGKSPAEKKKKAMAAAAGPAIQISPGIIVMVVLVGMVVTGVVLAYIGPVRVWHQWEDVGPKAENDITDVVSFGVQAYLSNNGYYNPSRENHRPEVQPPVNFYRPVLVMSMPDKVKFFGRTDQGPFEGFYSPKTGEIEATVSYGAMSHLAFGADVSVKETVAGNFHMTGRENNGAPEAEVDGKKISIYYPPKDPP